MLGELPGRWFVLNAVIACLNHSLSSVPNVLSRKYCYIHITQGNNIKMKYNFASKCRAVVKTMIKKGKKWKQSEKPTKLKKMFCLLLLE